MKKINVTKAYLPPFEEYTSLISRIWENNFLTNYGPLNNELVEKLKEYIGAENLHYVTNGTLAIQLAIESLNAPEGEIITTPFSFIATTNSIVWEKYKPVFVDIDSNNFGIDPSKIESAINDKTRAILAVHCYGFPCDVEKIDQIGKQYNIPVIYDAAHCFGEIYNGKSLYKYGDISCSSLHATKVFHSVEGGLIIVNNEKYDKKVNAIKNFGYEDGEYKYAGINGKDSEFHAAMGICVLNHFDEIVEHRKAVYNKYTELLSEYVTIPKFPDGLVPNYIYYPVIFDSEEQLLKVMEDLNVKGVNIRRYFYPSLNTLSFYGTLDKCPISEDISKRIACLPIDSYISLEDVEYVANLIIESVGSKCRK